MIGAVHRVSRRGLRTTRIQWPRTATCPTSQLQIADLSCSVVLEPRLVGVVIVVVNGSFMHGSLRADELQSIRQQRPKSASSLGPPMIQRAGEHRSKAQMPWGPPQGLQSARIGHDGIGITGSSIAQMTGMGWLEARRAASTAS